MNLSKPKPSTHSQLPVVITAILLVLSVLVLNPWLLKPFLNLYYGPVSPLRVFCVWLYDLFAVVGGGYLLLRGRKTLSFKTLVFAAMLLLLLGVAGEVLLQAIYRLSPPVADIIDNKQPSFFVPDEQFGRLPNPDYPSHDANGFRNAAALSTADIVTLGDSQTYGMGVSRDENWPTHLSSLAGRRVYNMAFGSCGPVQGLALLRRALPLKPDLVIFALYEGNDLYDSYLGVYQYHLSPEYKSSDPLVLEAIANADSQGRLQEQVIRAAVDKWKSFRQDSASVPVNAETGGGVLKLIKRGMLCRLFFSLEDDLFQTLVNTHEYRYQVLSQQKENYEIFSCSGFNTILTPEYFQLAVDMNDPRIREGLRLSKQALYDMQQVSEAHGIDYLVLLIPTKEKVFSGFYPSCQLPLPDSLRTFVEVEDAVRGQIKTFLESHGIAYIDMLPVYEASFSQKMPIFFPDHDCHLNRAGQQLTAETVYQYLQSRSDRDAQTVHRDERKD